MILALDIGNTAVKGGLFDGAHLARTFRLATDPAASVPTYRHTLRRHLDGAEVERIGIASVVPGVAERVTEAVRAETLRVPVLVRPSLALPFEMGYRTPETLGADRLAAAAGAWNRYRTDAPDRPLVVVDAGTAVTVEVVSADGVFLGGAIGAGPDLVRRALARGTGQLPEVEAEIPKRAVGRSTEEGVHAGTMLPFLDGVRGLLARVAGELDAEPLVIATGGWGGLLAEHISRIDHTESHLVLRGVRVLLGLNP
ncbi:MAG: type III pantothenate kinase [Bacteroidota bacterium]